MMKAISVSCKEDIEAWRDYADCVDYLLFDTKCPTAGGSGQQFDWQLLDAYDGDIPFLLSGGIGPGDAPRVKAFSHPRCIGIDLNSRFELQPGLKDVDALRSFINSL
jgi:phosphoribosylanthranilate isomerase